MKVEKALSRLKAILPVKQTLDQLDETLAVLYLAIVHGFYLDGRAPRIAELEQVTTNVAQKLAQLHRLDMLTLQDSGEVEGCYPFTMQKRVHRILINGHEVHAMCALDALAPGAMFECDSVVLSECAVTSEKIRIELHHRTIVNEHEVAQVHFGMNWLAASACGSCADSLCTEMLFLKDRSTAEMWLRSDVQNREIFTLPQAIDFSAAFFKPLLQQG